jgi:hypothetical protein
MSTRSDRAAGQQVARHVHAPQHRFGNRRRVDDVVRAGDARLDALHVHGSLIRVLGGHVDAA